MGNEAAERKGGAGGYASLSKMNPGFANVVAVFVNMCLILCESSCLS